MRPGARVGNNQVERLKRAGKTAERRWIEWQQKPVISACPWQVPKKALLNIPLPVVRRQRSKVEERRKDGRAGESLVKYVKDALSATVLGEVVMDECDARQFPKLRSGRFRRPPTA
jgi:hypothetical protein